MGLQLLHSPTSSRHDVAIRALNSEGLCSWEMKDHINKLLHLAHVYFPTGA
jgi:hypothetical protein